ncbi:MAG: VTT domain-containing protein [Flavobacteriales bacterium]|nr:VTT domain-containing protein [Flavobacteriales bacterium]
MKQFKKYLRWTWITLILITVTFFLIYPDSLTAECLKTLLHDNSSLILIVFIALSCIRALFFLPSTLFVLMGTVLYPVDPVFVLIVSMIGILIGATLVYKAAAILTPEQLFKGKNLTRMEGVRRKMDKYGFSIVLLWSFFPAVPTDLICYVAGTIKMTFWKFIFAVFLGEIILVSIYIWTGKSIIELLF